MGAVIHLGVGRGSARCPGYRLHHHGWGSNEVLTADGCAQGPREAAILTRALQQIGMWVQYPSGGYWCYNFGQLIFIITTTLILSLCYLVSIIFSD